MSGSKRRTLVFLLILCLLPAGVFQPAGAAGTLTLPANLKTVPAELFRDDQAISAVVLPDGVSEIGSKAFAGSSLKEITIPASIGTIAADAFEGCTAETLHITKASVKEIRERMFYQCGWFSAAEIGDGIETIGPEAFAESALTDIAIPASVTAVSEDAFADCALEILRITSKSSVSRTLHAGLFRGRQDFTRVVIESGLTTIESEAFADSALTDITIPGSVTAIADDAFAGCALESIHVTKGSYAYNWMRDKGYIREYRALLIGQQRFLRAENNQLVIEEANRNIGDVSNYMAPTLRNNVTGVDGLFGPEGRDFLVTSRTNLSYGALRSAIQTTFKDTRDQDVSVFFIATHGKSWEDGELEMAYNGNLNNPDSVYSFTLQQFVPFSTLAAWLKTYVRGKVFVILESCGAGSAIYPPDPEDPGDNAAKRGSDDEEVYDPKEFVREAVEAFAKADPGLTEVRQDQPDQLRNGPQKNSTGDLKVEKFYVLAAAAHHEESYGPPGDTHNFFTEWLTEGIGCEGNSPADRNADQMLTLQELYSYISEVGDNYISTHFSGYEDQHVQCWPANSSISLLKLK